MRTQKLRGEVGPSLERGVELGGNRVNRTVSLVGPLIRYVDRIMKQHHDQMVTVVLPEFVPAKWWHHLLPQSEAL